MTNKEKAKILAIQWTSDVDDNGNKVYDASVEAALLEMAKWKDEQFAKEKQELIDKACEWIGNYLMDLGYPDDWMRDSKTIPSGEQLFRKAMKGGAQ